MQTKHLPLPNSKISWPDLYFTAETSREAFEDVVVVTLKSDFVDRVHDVAISDDCISNPQKLNKRICQVLSSNQITVCERVEVTKRGIRAIVSRDIIDESAIMQALNMVSTALDQLQGQCGVVNFGQAVSFHSAEIGWLHTH